MWKFTYGEEMGVFVVHASAIASFYVETTKLPCKLCPITTMQIRFQKIQLKLKKIASQKHTKNTMYHNLKFTCLGSPYKNFDLRLYIKLRLPMGTNSNSESGYWLPHFFEKTNPLYRINPSFSS